MFFNFHNNNNKDKEKERKEGFKLPVKVDLFPHLHLGENLPPKNPSPPAASSWEGESEDPNPPVESEAAEESSKDEVQTDPGSPAWDEEGSNDEVVVEEEPAPITYVPAVVPDPPSPEELPTRESTPQVQSSLESTPEAPASPEVPQQSFPKVPDFKEPTPEIQSPEEPSEEPTPEIQTPQIQTPYKIQTPEMPSPQEPSPEILSPQEPSPPAQATTEIQTPLEPEAPTPGNYLPQEQEQEQEQEPEPLFPNLIPVVTRLPFIPVQATSPVVRFPAISVKETPIESYAATPAVQETIPVEAQASAAESYAATPAIQEAETTPIESCAATPAVQETVPVEAQASAVEPYAPTPAIQEAEITPIDSSPDVQETPVESYASTPEVQETPTEPYDPPIVQAVAPVEPEIEPYDSPPAVQITPPIEPSPGVQETPNESYTATPVWQEPSRAEPPTEPHYSPPAIQETLIESYAATPAVESDPPVPDVSEPYEATPASSESPTPPIVLVEEAYPPIVQEPISPIVQVGYVPSGDPYMATPVITQQPPSPFPSSINDALMRDFATNTPLIPIQSLPKSPELIHEPLPVLPSYHELDETPYPRSSISNSPKTFQVRTPRSPPRYPESEKSFPSNHLTREASDDSLPIIETIKEPDPRSSSISSLSRITPSQASYGSIHELLKDKVEFETISLCGDDLDDSKGLLDLIVPPSEIPIAYSPELLPETISAPEKVSYENLPEIVSETIPEDAPENVEASEKTSCEDAPEIVSEYISEHVPTEITENKIEVIREGAPEIIETRERAPRDRAINLGTNKSFKVQSESKPTAMQYLAHLLVPGLPILSRVGILACLVLPPLWPMLLAYAAFLCYDRSHEKGYRDSESNPNSSLGQAFSEYFPTHLKTECQFHRDAKYIFVYHSHSDSHLAAFAAFTAQPKLPLNIYLITPQDQFRYPIYREFLLFSNMAKDNFDTITSLLTRGHSCLIPTRTDPSHIHDDIFQLAIDNNASLVPVFGFGDASLFDPPSQLDTQLNSYLDLPFPAMYSRSNRPTLANPFPTPTPLSILVGSPIQPHTSIPSARAEYLQLAKSLHSKYVSD